MHKTIGNIKTIKLQGILQHKMCNKRVAMLEKFDLIEYRSAIGIITGYIEGEKGTLHQHDGTRARING